MESQYSYSDAHSRNTYDMIRTLQAPHLGNNYRLEGNLPRHGLLPAANYSNYSQSSQLPPLNSHDGSTSGYGQVPPGRPQQTSPVTNNVPFPPSYSSQPPYSSGVSQFATSTSLPRYGGGSYGFSNPALSYQGEYSTPSTGLPDFRGMTSTSHAQSMSTSMAPITYGLSAPMDDYQSRTHVVGAQGRRGILPSDEGRPPAIGPKATQKNATVPQKDQNGKFPCPHCNKTYLHAKHLKRHLLRHTGDRPYSCVLCNDTFSRSDILKRHFQKCSIRRGNPTGATHLSNPSAYTKKQPNRKSSGSGPAGEVRPATSDSDSATSTHQSAADMAYDHAGLHRDMGMAGMSGPPHHHVEANGIGSAPPSAMSAYGTSSLDTNSTTSPSTGRPPMGYYENGPFPTNGYMES